MRIRQSTTASWAMVATKLMLPTSGRRCASIASPACCRRLRSARSRSSRESEKPVEIDMAGEMRGEFVERLLDLRFIGKFRTCAEALEPGGALAILGEKPMDISAHHAPIPRYRAVGPSVGEAQQRRGAAGAARPADMHFIAMEGRAIRQANALNGG